MLKTTFPFMVRALANLDLTINGWILLSDVVHELAVDWWIDVDG